MEKTDEQICLGGKEVFSNAEFYHLRNCLVEILEEVKLRRGNDTESEERIKLLVNEKYQLERRCDAEVGQLAAVREQHQRHVTDLERSLQEKMRLLEEENKQLKIYRKCGEKETETLKDSVRSLQLSKYSLEKNLREQEHKLQSHLSSSDQQLGELSALEQKLRSMTVHFQHLSNSQERLEKNVTEAVKLNRSLMYVNEHQKCVMEQQKADLHRCQQQLVTLRTQLESQPIITADTEELNQRLASLQYHMNLIVEQRCALEKELDDYKARHKVSLDDLHEMNSLVERHLDNADQHRLRNAELDEMNQTLKSMVKLGEEEVVKLQQELDVERVVKAEALTQWKTQEEVLKTNLLVLQSDLAASDEARTGLETLNLQLEETNTKLKQQYLEVKAVVDRDKTDATQQTSLSYFNTQIIETQTENETSIVSTQTIINTADGSVQTQCETNSASSQTHNQCVSSTSQTIVPPLANSSSQTDGQDLSEHVAPCLVGEMCLLPQKGEIFHAESNGLETVETQEKSVSTVHEVSEPELETGSSGEIDMNDDAGRSARDSDSCIILEIPDIPKNCDSNSLKSDGICGEDALISADSPANNSTMTLSEPYHDISSRPGRNLSTVVSGTASSSSDTLQFLPLHRYKAEEQSGGRRMSLPVAQHRRQMMCKDSPLAKSQNYSESDLYLNKDKHTKVSPGRSQGVKIRCLYSESPVLWGAPCPGEEPKDVSRLSSTSQPNASFFASVSEKWSVLVEAEEQAKKHAPSPGRSPRSTPKMGLRILSETSPSRRRSTGFEGIPPTAQFLIDGFESSSSVSPGKKLREWKHHDDGQGPSAADEGRNATEYRGRTPQQMSPKAHRDAQHLIKSQKAKVSPRTQRYLSAQRCLQLQASTIGPFEMSEGTSLYVGKKADANKQQDKSPRSNSKGILKATWSANKPAKTVRFGSIMVSQAQSVKTSLPTAASQPPSQKSAHNSVSELSLEKPAGEQLLFSDDDDLIDPEYGNNKPQAAPVVQPRKRKREDVEDKT
ncbi:coiled-coil domain-containing protein 73-like [Haliotis rufescens]|uniref:coiled-coil domain-containing protein 73-like n=1 Tax=Haliotis rufescens TaxID=6454 RepID=UPI00201F90DB|nr:coiled-coil domain-containing protein 73-like [Haliotis rufescens]XP_048249261.1 coiled-coil domain-containing protein 73-like [Haliotis rufescens]